MRKIYEAPHLAVMKLELGVYGDYAAGDDSGGDERGGGSSGRGGIWELNLR